MKRNRERWCFVHSHVALETAGGEPAFPSLTGLSIYSGFSPRSLPLFTPLKETLKNLSLFINKNKNDILSGLQCLKS